MNEQDIMIEVNHMSHIYTDENGNDVRALDDVNLSIKRGEFVCIIGTNGSGKSTLAKHFNVLLQPSEGHINVCGFYIFGSILVTKTKEQGYCLLYKGKFLTISTKKP